VTHDQSEALTMSNRIAVFNDGVVQQLSTPAELYERPKNSFVAQFIGENNKLKGTGGGGRQRRQFRHIKLETGDMVKALAVNVKKGERTLLSVRPERVEINPGKIGGRWPAQGPHRRTDLSWRPHPRPPRSGRP
jgi:putative spermidine/putrescine transport system ATP-binding protein